FAGYFSGFMPTRAIRYGTQESVFFRIQIAGAYMIFIMLPRRTGFRKCMHKPIHSRLSVPDGFGMLRCSFRFGEKETHIGAELALKVFAVIGVTAIPTGFGETRSQGG